VYRLHKAVKVSAALVPKRQALVEKVHEPSLASTDTTPKIKTASAVWWFGEAEASAESLPGARLMIYQFVAQAREGLQHASLLWIFRVTVLLQCRSIEL
jgi:hypothetical protein